MAKTWTYTDSQTQLTTVITDRENGTPEGNASTLEVVVSGTGTWSNPPKVVITLYGNSSARFVRNITSSGGRVTASFSISVDHNLNGAKTMGVEVALNDYPDLPDRDQTIRPRINCQLTAIERRSSLSADSVFVLDGETEYNMGITKRVANTIARVQWLWSGGTANLIDDTTGDGVVFAPAAELANQITTGMTRTATLRIRTYAGSTIDASKQIGYRDYSVTFSVPDYELAGTYTIAHADTKTTGSTWVAEISALRLLVSGATANYGVTPSIVWAITGGGQGTRAGGASVQIDGGVLQQSSAITVSVILQDSRGKTAVATTTSPAVSAIPYVRPTIVLMATRTDGEGRPTASGDHYKAAILSGTPGTSGSAQWKIFAGGVQIGTTQNAIPAGGYSPAEAALALSSTLVITATVRDAYGTEIPADPVTIGQGIIYMQYGGGANGTGVAIGGESNQDALQVHLPADFDHPVKIRGTNGIERVWSGTMTTGTIDFSGNFSDYKAFLVIGYPYDSSSARGECFIPAEAFASANTSSATYAFGIFDNDTGITFYAYHVGEVGHLKYRSRSGSAAIVAVYGLL